MSRERHLGAIRGATTVDHDDATAIRTATAQLLRRIVALNSLAPSDILSALFTVTADLRSAFPAHAARELGWKDVALLFTMEIPIPGAIERCVRVLLHVETTTPRSRLRHVYLRGARYVRNGRMTRTEGRRPNGAGWPRYRGSRVCAGSMTGAARADAPRCAPQT